MRDGRFRLAGLGAERVVNLTLEGGAIASDEIHVVTRKMDADRRAAGFGNQSRAGIQDRFMGPTLPTLQPPSRPIEGVIKDCQVRADRWWAPKSEPSVRRVGLRRHHDP